MEPLISQHHGFIDKYIGDAIMALFSGSANDALNACIAMLKCLEIYNDHRKISNYLPIKIGIGINTGSLILGTVGGHRRMDVTVMSDSVNLAARIESLTKDYKVSLLITHHTFNALKNPDNYAIRMIDLVNVKGKNEIITIYEVFDADPDKIKAAKYATLDLFNRALTFYNEQNFEQAQVLFKQCLENNPQDSVSQLFLSRIVSQ